MQKNLACQLWLIFECLIAGRAGSLFILNQEAETSTMKPVAESSTKFIKSFREICL